MTTKFRYRQLIALIVAGLCLLPSAFATTRALDASHITDAPVALTEYFSVLQDPSTDWTLDDVQSPALAALFKNDHRQDQPPAYGTTAIPYWFRFQLSNPTDQPLERFIEINYPRISDVQLFTPTTNNTYESLHTGAAQPFATRAYPNRNFVFPVTLPAQSEQTYYFRLRSNTNLLVPVQVWTPQAFQSHERTDYMTQAWYFGISTAMGLFNLLLFIALREKIYLLYVLFAATTVVTFSAFFGMATEFLWPNAGFMAEKAIAITAVLQASIFSLFTQHMLNTPTIVPRLNRCLMIVVGVLLLLLAGDLASIPGAFALGQIFVILVYVLIFAIALYCVLIRDRRAYFFVIAFTFYLLGVITYTLTSMGLVVHNQFTANAGQMGSVLEMLLLAFALADRFNIIRKEKYQAQEEALRTKQSLLDSVRASERQLEARVAQRTEELNVAMHKLEELSVTDSLTGIANRRRFDAALLIEWKRAERTGAPLALAMLDVDHFKQFNDLYGHPQGDACLQQIARVLMENISRPAELIARYGGEEFAFIVPNATGSDAVQLAQKVCDALRAYQIPHADTDGGYVTASIGVASMTPQAGESPATLIQAADAALYRAKASGRNQVVLANNDNN